MTDIQDLERIKKKVDSLKEDLARSKGALQEATRNLKKEFGVGSLKEGKDLLKRLTGEEGRIEKAFQRALESYEESFGSLLDGDGEGSPED